MITLEWTEEAIREIISKIWPNEDPNNAENKKWIDSKVKELLPIIERRCPEDKAVGKLVETAKELCDDFGVNLQTYDAHRYNLVDKLRTALSEHEEVNK